MLNRRPALLLAAASAVVLSPPPLSLPLVPAALAAGQGETEPVAETIVFVRNLSPTEAVAQFKHTYRGGEGKAGAGSLPDGVVSLTPDEKKGVVYVKGTREGIQTVMRLMPLIDVAPRRVEVRAKVVAVRFGPDGSRREEVLQAPRVSTVVNRVAEVRVTPGKGVTGGTQLAFTPRLNDAGDQVTLRVRFGMVWDDGTSDGIERTVALPAGLPRRIVGLANVKDTKLREAVALGRMPSRWPGSFTAYYVDAEAAEIKGNAGSGAGATP